MLENYETALDHYLAGAYKKAHALWEKYPLDPPSHAMAERCSILISGNIQLTDGIYDMHEK